MKKLIVYILVALNLSLLAAPTTYAQQGILPATEKSLNDCREVINAVEWSSGSARSQMRTLDREDKLELSGGVEATVNDVLACATRTGAVSLWMIPFYVKYILEFVLSIAGLLAVGGVVYGGYFYLFAGVTDDKERGKKAIIYSIAGFILALTAWALVNIVISLLTTL